MDAVAELSETFAPTYEGWAEELPKAMAGGPRAFKDWADQGPTLIATAQALGLDISKVAAGGGAGHVTTTGRRSSPGVQSSRSRTRSAGNGRSTPVTSEQIVSHLRGHPGASAKTIATALHASYDTVQKRLRELTAAGTVRREGERQNTTFFAAGMAGAGTG